MSTIAREFTKEQLQQIIETDHVQCGEASALARIALASLEAEPVCVIDQSNLDYLKSGSDADVWPASRTEMGDVLLYRAAPPAPVSVPAAMEMDDDFDSAFEHGKAVGWNACRAAMLQGADGTLTNEGTITATQFKPVADLYGLTSPTGGETSFTFDAVEARDFIDGGWSCQEYVELERFQEAVSGNSPVIPDGWVIVPAEPTAEMLQSGISAHYERNQIQIHDRPAPGPMECAYVAMLAAAPQQEVK
ncbi:hypothetical protein ACLLXJ_002886 [Salmonella enterica]|uniref:hypothetical protein n=1 Tax=Citrobacter freundii TaxID=546 RepID=UPI003AAE1A85